MTNCTTLDSAALYSKSVATTFASMHLPTSLTQPKQRRFLKGASQAAFALVAVSTPTAAPAIEAASSRPFRIPTTDAAAIETVWHSVVPGQSATEKVVERIRALSDFRDGWFKPSSRAPKIAALREAERFARFFAWDKLRHPDVCLAEDGEVNFAWRSDRLYLDLGFIGDGTYSFYAEKAEGETFTGDDIIVDDQSGISLINSLISVA